MKKFLFVTATILLFANVAYSQCEPISTFPWIEGFENNGTNLPPCWEQEVVSGNGGYNWDWKVVPESTGTPSSAHGGNFKAQIFSSFLGAPVYKKALVTPVFDLTTINEPELSFWHTQRGNRQLVVYYKNSLDGEWTLLKFFDAGSIPDWQEDRIILPEKSDYYQIAFEGIFYGGGSEVQLDDISIREANALYNIIVISNPPVCFADGGSIYPYGTIVTILAAPCDGYNFVNWLENGIEVSTDATYTFTVTGSRTLVANYETYDLITLPSPLNGGMVYGNGNFPPGIEATVSATANIGYDFINWTRNGVEVSIDASYTFITAIENEELVANFEKSSLGIEVIKNSINIYPNPTTGKLRIENGEWKIESIGIYDVFGKELMKINTIRKEMAIDISHLSTGVYFVKINTEVGEVVRKVVKE